MVSEQKKTILAEVGFSLLTAILLLLVCSKSSPLYPMNDWVDVDCIFTMGKSIGEGLVPYRDLFDHKGPVLYFLFFIASLISKSSFFGVWILEVISVAGLLYFSMQSAKLFVENKKVIYITMPIVALVMLTTRAFTHGGSTEELVLLPLSYSLYYFLRVLKGEKIGKKEHLIPGICLGAIFWMKFTLVGFYIGAYLVVIIDRMRKKDMEGLVKDILMNIAGFFIITVPVFLYFAVNGAVNDLWEVYFYDNIFLYKAPETMAQKLANFHTRVKMLMYYNTDMVVPVLISIAVNLFKGRAKETAFIMATFFTAALGIYIGGYYSYYAMVMALFAFMGITLTDECCILFKAKFKKNDSTIGILPFVSMALCFMLSFNITTNAYLMDYEQEDLPQYKFAEIINSSENPTLLNYKFLDGGFYFAADITPMNKFFYKSNLKVDGMDEEQDKLIEDRKVEFVVTRQEKENSFVISCGYEVVAKDKLFFEGKDRTYYLYQRK